MRTLVTGGARSGKSTHAEGLLEAEPVVTYVAPGPTPDEDTDPDWAARIAAHRERRPEGWRTVETRDLARAVRESRAPVLVDCLGTWLAALLDEHGVWDLPAVEASGPVDVAVDRFVESLRASSVAVVIVTNEVGMGIVPEHRSGRLFRDLLGRVNQRVAAECDDVLLVVAGRALRL